jgi:hypothetical protein
VLAHEPGEEIQWDWLELTQTPWGEPAHVLIGALAFSGKARAVICEGESFPHLAEAIDGVLRRLGGTTRAWRTDRMATVVTPGTDRITGQFAQLAKHYGVQVWVCPARRPQRKGVVEAAVKYITRSWWRTAPVSTLRQAQADLDRWALAVSDRRKRRDATIAELAAQEPLLALPAMAFPAVLEVGRVVSRTAMVAFEGNRYSVPPGMVAQTVTVRARLGEPAPGDHLPGGQARGSPQACRGRRRTGAAERGARPAAPGCGARRVHDRKALPGKAKPAARSRGTGGRGRAARRAARGRDR